MGTASQFDKILKEDSTFTRRGCPSPTLQGRDFGLVSDGVSSEDGKYRRRVWGKIRDRCWSVDYTQLYFERHEVCYGYPTEPKYKLFRITIFDFRQAHSRIRKFKFISCQKQQSQLSKCKMF